MRYLIISLLALLFLFASCKPHEERVIDRLNNLAEKVEKYGSKWDLDEWADALEELEDIHYDMEDCDFTSQQLKALGRVEGQLTVIIMTEGSKKLGDELVLFMEGAGSFMKGYQEGVQVTEGYNIEDIKNLNDNLEKELEKVQQELDNN